MTLFPPEVQSHGMNESQFLGRPRAARFHVGGFNEQGTTTTPFQIVVLNEISRYHLATLALQRANRSDIPTTLLIERCRSSSESATAYAHAHFEDPPKIANWI
jgi:xylulose-5-phosphate/fructose-6-phosphate phosphoketolase